MWKVVLDILGMVGGVGAVIIALSAWLGKVWANRILQKEIHDHNIELAELKTNLQREIDRSKTQLDIIKESSIRYAEYQFKLYNELWGELYALTIVADELWDTANEENLRRFVEQLKCTKEQINKNALLIEEYHFKRLLDLLSNFSRYMIGKQKLIDIYKNENQISQRDIQQMINQNYRYKTEYSEIIENLVNEFRHQLKFYNYKRYKRK